MNERDARELEAALRTLAEGGLIDDRWHYRAADTGDGWAIFRTDEDGEGRCRMTVEALAELLPGPNVSDDDTAADVAACVRRWGPDPAAYRAAAAKLPGCQPWTRCHIDGRPHGAKVDHE